MVFMLSFYLLLVDDASDKKLFELLYNENKNAMMACAMNILRNHEDAEDALQNAFLSIAKNFEKVKSVKEDERKFYCITIVRNAAYDLYSKNKKHSNTMNIDDFRDTADEDSYKQFVTKENYDIIVNAIKAMKDTYRDVLFLHLVQDMSTKEISEVLSKKPKTVKKQITRGKALLAELIQKEATI